jgi:uncharacterized protein
MMCFSVGEMTGRAGVTQLGLRSLQGDHEHLENRFEASLFTELGGDAFKVVSPVMLAMDVDRLEPGRYRLAGRFTGEVELSCGRCLESYRLAVATNFDLQYVPRSQNAGEGEREVEEDDLTTAYYDDDHIDLGELIAEQFQLALPMKPLCSEGCKGLCPHCGTNLNTETCDCSRQWEDPRFASLKQFKS